MLIYFFIFILSVIFAFFAFKTKKNKFAFIFFSCLAIIIPAFFAGIRIKGIGTDTNGYIDFVFYNCLSIKDFTSLLNYYSNSQVEFLFVFIDFFITRFTYLVNYSYFIFELIFLLFGYLACYHFDKDKFYFSYFLFLILYFNRSLNMCRQSIAIAIIMYNFKNIKDNKIFNYIFWIMIAMLFHKTAVIAILIYPLYKYYSNKKYGIVRKISIIILLILGLYFFNSLIVLLNNFGILDNKYMLYLNAESSTVSWFEIFFKILIIVISVLTYKTYTKKAVENEFLIFNFIIGTLLSLIGMKISFGQRISYYFTYFIIFYLNNFGKIFKGNKQKIIVNAFIIFCDMLYSYICFGILKWDQTVPFKSIF